METENEETLEYNSQTEENIEDAVYETVNLNIKEIVCRRKGSIFWKPVSHAKWEL